MIKVKEFRCTQKVSGEYMDYQKWGQEYLQEAALLLRHLQPVRQKLRQGNLGVEESRDLTARERILSQMYLECRATGNYLRGCCQ